MMPTRTRDAPSQQRWAPRHTDPSRTTQWAKPGMAAEKVYGVLVYQSACSEKSWTQRWDTLWLSCKTASAFFFSEYLFIYLLIYFWLHQVLAEAQGIFAAVPGLLSSYALGHTGSRVCGFYSLWHKGSRAVGCFPVECGMIVPQPGIKPRSPALKGRFSTPGPPAKSPASAF